MFTGIVTAVGVIVEVVPAADGRRLAVRDGLLGDVAVGGSVAVDGVCLTLTDEQDDVGRFDLSAETLSRSTLGHRSVGDRVNLERPMRAGDEFGGHIVQGHVDGIGQVERATREGGGVRMAIAVPPSLSRYLVEKGSVTVDGVSLTVTALTDDGFEAALVPHTLTVTTLGGVGPGRSVNIEVDVLAKYVERLVAPWVPAHGAGGSTYL